MVQLNALYENNAYVTDECRIFSTRCIVTLISAQDSAMKCERVITQFTLLLFGIIHRFSLLYLTV